MATQKKTTKGVKCDGIYKTASSINIHVTPVQAIAISRRILEKAQEIIEEKRTGMGVQIWNLQNSNTLSFGIAPSKKGKRKSK